MVNATRVSAGLPETPGLAKCLEGMGTWTSEAHPWAYSSLGTHGAWTSHCKGPSSFQGPCSVCTYTHMSLCGL